MPTLDWLNRDAAFRTAAQVPTRVLRPHRAAPAAVGAALGAAVGDDPAGSGNLLIQGDNLEALAALLPFYRGQVKCIFIDPPYNTKSAFEHYDDNLEHSQWLSMMLPRLQLLRELLSEDGSIWVTIDDNEGHYLKVLMDEVFGRRNFIANVVWQKKYAKQNDAQWLSTSHDHLFAYGRLAATWRPNKVTRTETQLKGFSNPDNDPRGPWQSVVYTCAKTRNERPNLFYPIKHPRTGATATAGTPLLGRHEGTSYWLLFNGVLGDRRPASGNVLTSDVLAALRTLGWPDGPKVDSGEACRLGAARLAAEGISFKQLPHAVPR